MIAACLLAFSIGFLSLCMEILWVRLFGFTNHSIPQAFAWVMVFYLLGIAFGALFGKQFCNEKYNAWRVSGKVLIAASMTNLLAPLLYVSFAHSPNQVPLGAALIFLTAFLNAIIFPMVHYLTTPNIDQDIGRKISRVYVANIMGATVGPIVTTMVFLAHMTTQQSFIICSLLTVIVALGCFLHLVRPLILTSVMAVILLFTGFVFNLSPHYLIAQTSESRNSIRRIIENQYGIIITYAGGPTGDIVFGGNVYDGRTNLDPLLNSNQINRLIILSALQEKPEKVLMIGLSVGTWLKLITTFPGVKSIDVIEINPGYLQVIPDYPAQLDSLHDPRVNLVFDDGRRWLKSHPENKYDLVIMNTTFHWRAYTSHLLSSNFLKLLQQHMLPHAVLAYNTTGSPDVLKTATSVFPHAYLYENFVIASDFDWRKKMLSPNAVLILSSLIMDGKPLFPDNSEAKIHEFLEKHIVDLSEVEATAPRTLEVITDKNLITEFKYGRWL
jgi:predicted membrane-bound spermidine synthase